VDGPAYSALFLQPFILTEEQIMTRLLASIFALTVLTQAGSIALAQMNHGSGHGQSDAKQEMTGIQVTGAWARATTSRARNGAAYVTLANSGSMSDKLVSVSTPVAGRPELHTHIKDGDIMRMRQVQHIEVGPNAMVTLQPGGLHIMLMELKEPLTKGATFPMTLVFEKAGEVTVEVAVQSAGAKGMGGAMDHGAHGGAKH
jgi:copper(I)-binding protein